MLVVASVPLSCGRLRVSFKKRFEAGLSTQDNSMPIANRSFFRSRGSHVSQVRRLQLVDHLFEERGLWGGSSYSEEA